MLACRIGDASGVLGSAKARDSAANRWSVVPRAKWQPGLLLRFKLRRRPPTGPFPANMAVFELQGTPQGDRYYLDQLGLLASLLRGTADPNPPEIESIALVLEKENNAGPPTRLQPPDWTIVRTNLTREARSGQMMVLAAARPAPPALPYVAQSGRSEWFRRAGNSRRSW
jgi:hypothetical protein